MPNREVEVFFVAAMQELGDKSLIHLMLRV